MARDIEKGRPATESRGGDRPTVDAPADAGEGPSAEAVLDAAATILTASGEVPALLHEVLELQANVLGGAVSEDMVFLLLEAAINHHLPDVLTDERAWAQELARLAGV